MAYLDFKKVSIFIFCAIVAISCGQKHREIDKVKIAENYIGALNASDYHQVVGLFLDSIRFNELDYIRTFTKEDYHTLFQWDSVFRPKYKILDVKEVDGNLHLRVSKEGQRIRFLQNRPFITKEIMNFKDGSIYSVDIVEYVDFNDSLWGRNRENLVSWIRENHPELDGFINDQTKIGALKFQKAMALYGSGNDSVSDDRKIKKL
ncbi:MAG: hypothetical protein CMH46_19140 [Muricauda sp.]|nr:MULTISPECIES: hypothetical protein [unclassified Allomuricauda]MAU17648.1 hypothetical protein [Allomuricauda sp.]|tara:strand:- start:65 stop:679 length:615 start_codon:yes stop_codon:yes gene_type:complete